MSETQFAMISDWMVNGNINDFVKAHPATNRLELVGFSIAVSGPLLQVRWQSGDLSSWETSLAG